MKDYRSYTIQFKTAHAHVLLEFLAIQIPLIIISRVGAWTG